ncbi:MAG: hydrogenase expression/formation protein HypC [Pseudonocardiales bacterium]|jgi:hydrogenase expression/formation protein HypC|nr:hydrogenase expression/formation protein HypC [Pseudonocardiales bacterium]
MCLGLPGRIVSVDEGSSSDGASRMGDVEVAGVVRRIDLSLLRGPLLPGEHVLIHSGTALERMSADRAWEAEALFAPPGMLREELAQDQRLPG